MTKRHHIKYLAAIAAVALSCTHPIYDGGIADLGEQQSVWQYLSVYSIYQDKVPPQAGNMTPEQLFSEINDTLGGARYTGYLKSEAGGGGAAAYISNAQDNRDAAFKITDSTAYLRLSEFSELTLGHFNAWRTGILSNTPNIVIDLRGNGGGSLTVTDSIVGEFIPFGSEFISARQRVYDSRKHAGHTVDWTNVKSTKKPGLGNKNISVIIDRNSASASEILAAALKDCANARLAGQRSYGKGIGQVIISRMGKKTLSVTFMEIRGVPGGKVGEYHRTGIPPDQVPADLDKEAEDLQPAHRDLYIAVKLLEKSAPDRSIQIAANYIQINGLLLRKSAEQTGAYMLVYEDDPE